MARKDAEPIHLPSASWERPANVPEQVWNRHKAYHTVFDALARGLVPEQYPTTVEDSLQSAPGFTRRYGLELPATVHALASLEAQGLIEQELDKGFASVPLNAEVIIANDLPRREELEVLAVTRLAERDHHVPLPLGSELQEDLEHQAGIIKKMAKTPSLELRDAFRSADACFHADLAFAADLDVAAELIQDWMFKSRVFESTRDLRSPVKAERPATYGELFAQNKGILQAAQDREPDKAVRRVRGNIQAAAALLRR